MKVIFVASGNKTGGQISPFVKSQYESLEAAGLDMRLLPVNGHGAGAYLKAAWRLRKMVRKEHPDIIHAHYSICGHVAWLATVGMWKRPKIVVSILGSFPRKSMKLSLVRFCIKHLWDKTLVKSARTRDQLGLELPVIPNGVNLEIFHPIDYGTARKAVGFDERVESEKLRVKSEQKKYVIWCSHPTRPEKNYALAQEAVRRVKESFEHKRDKNSEKLIVNSVELVAVYDKTPEEVCTYMNAADCLLLTSNNEGSPNVIKEAMACNCPIVTTDVGDVTERLHDLEGCFVVEGGMCNVESVAEAIQKAIAFGKRTEGRKRLVEDGLTVELNAKKIMELYESVIRDI